VTSLIRSLVETWVYRPLGRVMQAYQYRERGSIFNEAIYSQYNSQ
jgi:hypothetical protein